MPSPDWIREIATQACSEALQEKLRELSEAVGQRMGAALESQPPQRGRTRELRDGALLIASCGTQPEALEMLLSASSAITPSCGLMMLRGTQASGWNCVGLASVEEFKRATMDCSKGVVAAVLGSCSGRAIRASELDPIFTGRLGLENSAELLLLPVFLKQQATALLLAVSGDSDDLAGLEILVQVAQLAMEIERKSAPTMARPEPVFAAAAEMSGGVQKAEAIASPQANSKPSSPTGPPAAGDRDEIHEKARRFAKLLVDEIKLYNQSKVSEGRANRDLYSRLRDDIEKSRAAYQKRYGEGVRDVDYFTQELIRILADNDPSVMGAGFPR
jgi:hypothetical protein